MPEWNLDRANRLELLYPQSIKPHRPSVLIATSCLTSQRVSKCAARGMRTLAAKASIAPYASQCPVPVTAVTRAVELDRPQAVLSSHRHLRLCALQPFHSRPNRSQFPIASHNSA